MASDYATIEQTALKLALKERAALAERLLESLDNLTESEHEKLCADEAERRYKAFKQGRFSLIPAKDVFGKVRKKD